MKKVAKKGGARGTRPSQFRLGADTLAQLDRIAASIGATTRAAAIRFAAARAAAELDAPAKTA